MSVTRTATDFFDPSLYGMFPVRHSECWGCDRPWRSCTSTATARRVFRRLTGQGVGKVGQLSLNLSVDFRTLGLPAVHVPERIELCVGCAAAYMQQFNHRLGGEGGCGEVRPGSRTGR